MLGYVLSSERLDTRRVLQPKKYEFKISHPSERELALTILRLPEAVDAAARDLMVNRITDLLYDTSQRVSDFYSSVRVIGSDE